MLTISRVTADGRTDIPTVDEAPRISFALASDTPGEALASARLSCEDWTLETTDQINNRFGGPLRPFSEYRVRVDAIGTSGDAATAETVFRTGRLGTPWQARWITDDTCSFPKKSSPVPMVFRGRIDVTRPDIVRATVTATALGVYDLSIGGRRVSEEYFRPGFTSYRHRIQYQTYDVTDLVRDGANEVVAVVAGGWAVGSFTYHRKNKISADRQAFLLELRLEHADGSVRVWGTDESWQVTQDGPYRMAEWYDGETFDATVDPDRVDFRSVSLTDPAGDPEIVAQIGPSVTAHEELTPVEVTTSPSGETIYDFGQNFAGVVRARLRGRAGQEITFRHAEVTVDGELFVKSLRTARATATYVCRDGEQEYSPRLTYMGFRFVGVRGVDPDDLELTALVLHSDVEETGEFECSDPLVNRLHENIRWGGKSNFVDIPTDCPQRDERQGWTGDFAVFARTAFFNHDLQGFTEKWLRDLRAEQGRGGGYPMVVPRAGDPFPAMATACWGDVGVLAPWAAYLAGGDLDLLRRQYPSMKRFLRAATWWARLFSLRQDRRHVWRFPFHFGDWAAPTGAAREWIARGKWVATAYLANSAGLAATIARILGEDADADTYDRLRDHVVRAYRNVFTDGNGRLKDEFQTGYVLPLAFGMTDETETRMMLDRLEHLIEDNGGHLATGFPGTPYILFALSDHGRADAAYELLLKDTCPSWLYQVKSGGTTIWERWDGLRPDGTVNIADLSPGSTDEDSGGGMVSFNHYAGGAVGDWLYRRTAGIEPTTGGYRTFRVAPLVGGGITRARARVATPYGTASSSWHVADDILELRVEVPVSTTCTVVLPDGAEHTVQSGIHRFQVPLIADVTVEARS